tara:strand:+ start:17 stop:1447 length:1431 start_codon:yes stop_codon:yes gene_type:complete
MLKNKRSYDYGVDWLIGIGRERGNLHNLEDKGIYKAFEGGWNQKYAPKDLITHLINYANMKNRNSYMDELPRLQPYQERNKVKQGQISKWIKPLMKDYCSCILAFGLINYLNCCEPSKQEANLYYFHKNVTLNEADWLPKSCVTDEEFNSIYAFLQADIKETRKVDWKSAIADTIPTWTMSGEQQLELLCPLHDDNEESLAISLKELSWMCHTGCGAGTLHNFITKAKGKYWHELKPNYLIDAKPLSGVIVEKTNEVNNEGPVGLIAIDKPRKKIVSDIETIRLPEDHWVITERGFDHHHLLQYKCKATINGGLYLPYITNGKEIGYMVGHSKEYLENNPKAGKYMVKKGFKNSNYLFGINQVWSNNLLFIVEGAMDAISLNYYNYSAVAVVANVTGGISPEQLKYIKAINPEEICLAYDNDPSGKKGQVKTLARLKESNFTNISQINWRAEDKDFGDLIKEPKIIHKYTTSRTSI